MFFKKTNFTSTVKKSCAERPFLATTQNLSYIQKLHPTPEKAFTILGSGDSVFQLVYRGTKSITAVDANENQINVFYLRRAAIKALNCNDFYEFLLRASSKNFLSRAIFERVAPYFGVGEIKAQQFWQNFFEKYTPIRDVHTYGLFFRGGIEFCGINNVRESLAFLKNPGAYQQLKQNLKSATITLHHSDAIDFLTQSGADYDWIDLSNVLVYYYQCASNFGPNVFSNNIKKLQEVWDRDVVKDGRNSVMVLDYMFGIGKRELENNLIKTRSAKNAYEKMVLEIYSQTFAELTADFGEVGIMETKEVADAMPTKGYKDSVLYVTK